MNSIINFQGGLLKVCLNFEKLEEKKSLESYFLSIVWFEESQKERKNREKSCKENLSCYEKKIFLPNMRGKWRKNLFLIVYQKR